MTRAAVPAPRTYYDSHFRRAAVKIIPGEYWVTGADQVIVTVLGSCVSACLHDPCLGIGGMNHFMLPACADDTRIGGAAARYGINAMELLLNELIKRGSSRARLEAKVFGGGNVLEGLTTLKIGARNAAFVHEFLHTEGIRIAGEDLLDVWPRKVAFFPRSGRALSKKLKIGDRAAIARREREYERGIDAAAAGEVVLF